VPFSSAEIGLPDNEDQVPVLKAPALEGPKHQEFQACPSSTTRIFQTQKDATAAFFCKCEKRLKTAQKNSKTVKI
jgi:hypothetical protein